MPGYFDDQSISIPCPECKKEHEKTIGWIKAHSSLACSCGVTITLDKSDLVSKLEDVERELDAIPREITIKF